MSNQPPIPPPLPQHLFEPSKIYCYKQHYYTSNKPNGVGDLPQYLTAQQTLLYHVMNAVLILLFLKP